MIRLTLVDHEGNAITPEDLSTVEDLREASEKGRTLIRECDRLARLMSPKQAGIGRGGEVPYRT